MGIFGLGKKKKEGKLPRQVREDNLWHVEGLVDSVLIRETNIEELTIKDIATPVRFVGTQWGTEILLQLESAGFKLSHEKDGVSYLLMPPGSHAIVRDVDGVTEAYIIDSKSVYAKITHNDFETFTFAPNTYTIVVTDGSPESHVVHAFEKPFAEIDVKSLLDAAKYSNFIKVNGSVITIDLYDDLELGFEDGGPVVVVSETKDICIEIFNRDDLCTVIIRDPYFTEVKPVAKVSNSPRIYLSSISQLKEKDLVTVMGRDGSIVVKDSKIRSINRTKKTIFLEDYEGIKEGMTLVLSEEGTVYIPTEIKKVEVLRDVKTMSYHAHILTTEGKTIASSFIRAPREGETIEQVLEEFIIGKLPSYYTEPYLYWKK